MSTVLYSVRLYIIPEQSRWWHSARLWLHGLQRRLLRLRLPRFPHRRPQHPHEQRPQEEAPEEEEERGQFGVR